MPVHGDAGILQITLGFNFCGGALSAPTAGLENDKIATADAYKKMFFTVHSVAFGFNKLIVASAFFSTSSRDRLCLPLFPQTQSRCGYLCRLNTLFGMGHSAHCTRQCSR